MSTKLLGPVLLIGHDLWQPMRISCDRHHRWIFIQNADGTKAERRCPECKGSRA